MNGKMPESKVPEGLLRKNIIDSVWQEGGINGTHSFKKSIVG